MQSLSNLTVIDQLVQAQNRIGSKEEILGFGLNMPNNSANSAPRRIMYTTQYKHRIQIKNPNVPLVGTGFEDKFGELSSFFNKSKDDIKIVHKIIRTTPLNYYLIVKNSNNEYDVIERKEYENTAETYGFKYDNTFLDSLSEGSIIKQGQTYKKSTSFDEYDNRMDGIDALSTYEANEDTKEDSIIICKSLSERMAAPTINTIQRFVNDNDIPLNLYGDDTIYKSSPDIGEDIQNGILYALRRANKEEALFAQSNHMLTKLMMSDDKTIATGTVVDIKVYCNNPELLNKRHYHQIKYYYDKQREFLSEFIQKVKPIMEDPNLKKSYNLQKMYYNICREYDGVQYVNDKVFSNAMIEFTVVEWVPAQQGDKISNRYGGKGVIAEVVDDELMPKLENGKHVELIWNSSTCFNRENPGQLEETEINFASSRLLEFFNTRVLDFEEMRDMYLKFISMVSPLEYEAVSKYLNQVSIDDQMEFMELILGDKGIHISILPLSEKVDIDVLRRIYHEFDFIKPYDYYVPQLDSMNNYRFIKASRKMVCGYQYIYRLKQHAKEKSSGVSLAATNIKNLNIRSSEKRNFKTPIARTPDRFGEMETGNMIHLGPENVVVNLMLHSLSPQGRRLAEGLLTGDPFNVDIKLDKYSKNREVEILNTYLLTMGLKLVIIKKKKEYQPILFRRPQVPLKKVFHRMYPDEVFDYEEHNRRCNAANNRIFVKKIFKRGE